MSALVILLIIGAAIFCACMPARKPKIYDWRKLDAKKRKKS